LRCRRKGQHDTHGSEFRQTPAISGPVLRARASPAPGKCARHPSPHGAEAPATLQPPGRLPAAAVLPACRPGRQPPATTGKRWRGVAPPQPRRAATGPTRSARRRGSRPAAGGGIRGATIQGTPPRRPGLRGGAPARRGGLVEWALASWRVSSPQRGAQRHIRRLRGATPPASGAWRRARREGSWGSSRSRSAHGPAQARRVAATASRPDAGHQAAPPLQDASSPRSTAHCRTASASMSHRSGGPDQFAWPVVEAPAHPAYTIRTATWTVFPGCPAA
jgi:hypothetical protein